MLRIVLSIVLITVTVHATAADNTPAPAQPGYVLPERDVSQSEFDAVDRRVKLLRLEAEEAELKARIAKATGDTSTPTNTGVPILTAILVTEHGQVAYFKDGKRTVKARKGDHVGGAWIVRAFVGNAVRLEHGETGSTYLAAIGAKAPEAAPSLPILETQQ